MGEADASVLGLTDRLSWLLLLATRLSSSSILPGRRFRGRTPRHVERQLGPAAARDMQTVASPYLCDEGDSACRHRQGKHGRQGGTASDVCERSSEDRWESLIMLFHVTRTSSQMRALCTQLEPTP